MARLAPGLVFVGIKGIVLALDRRDGTEAWRTVLKGSVSRSSGFVCVYRDGDLLFATSGGEMYCLDPKTGSVLWHNPLRGLGLGLTSIAGECGAGSTTLAATAAERARQQAAAAASG
jgi:outer membrane protein assembly factor BamB